MSATTPTPAEQHAHRLRLATAIADRAVVALVACEGLHVIDMHGVYDTSPLLDERECSPTCLDINRQELEYGRLRGLLVPVDHAQPHLVRIQHNANTRA
jgi:hypothetical protein